MLFFIAVTVTYLVSYETFSLISQSSSLCEEIYLLCIVTSFGSLKFLPQHKIASEGVFIII